MPTEIKQVLMLEGMGPEPGTESADTISRAGLCLGSPAIHFFSFFWRVGLHKLLTLNKQNKLKETRFSCCFLGLWERTHKTSRTLKPESLVL